jgi:hypothetical protein
VRRALLAAVLGLALAGCGASDEEQVRADALERIEAARSDDHERVCELTTPDQRFEMTDEESSSVEACAADLDAAGPSTARQRRAAPPTVEIEGRLRDGRASLSFTGADGCPNGGHVFIRGKDGDWQYDRSVGQWPPPPGCD